MGIWSGALLAALCRAGRCSAVLPDLIRGLRGRQSKCECKWRRDDALIDGRYVMQGFNTKPKIFSEISGGELSHTGMSRLTLDHP